MNDLVGYRDMELLCRHRAAFDPQHRWKWLGEAERWRELVHSETASRFHGEHAGPMAVGPITQEGARRAMQAASQREGKKSPLD
jgi:hypothetical protein